MACETLEERQAANAAKPCKKAFRPVFPEAIAGYVPLGILWMGMTVIGYGLSTERRWAVSNLIKPSSQLSIMLLLLMADHSSSFFDHSRISNENNCLTAMLTSTTLDETKGRLVFGGLAALLAAISARGISSGSVTLAATGVPWFCMMSYLCWSPQTFQSCKNNSLVTGLLAHSLDIMTLVGILEMLFSESGNRDKSWHTPTIVYSTVISLLFVALVGKYSDYGDRITPGSCKIDDEGDVEKEKSTDRKSELKVGIALSIVSLVFIVFLKMKYSEVGCCAAYPAIIWLLFDVLTKLQVWKRGEDALVGDALHRSVVYIMVQAMDILLSSSSLLSIMVEKGLINEGLSSQSRGLLSHGAHLSMGPLTYTWSILRLMTALASGNGNTVTTGSIKRLAEVVKMLSLNVFANIIPMAVDAKNAGFMLSVNPQSSLNVKCFVD
ncbi:unnamed protein product [Ectocarpus sp. 8 AP-2014]